MSGLNLYVLTYTARHPQGSWEANDDLRITGYGAPAECKVHIVAPSQALADVYWRESVKYLDNRREVTWRSIQQLESNVPIIKVM